MMFKVRVILANILLLWALTPSALANDGYFICTPPETLIGGTMGAELGSLLYGSMGVKSVADGISPQNEAYLALNFKNYPYKIEVHHSKAMYQSGFQVYRNKNLELVKSVIGTHSGATLYKTVDKAGLWSLVSQSGRELSENLPGIRPLNSIATGRAYVLVGRRVGLVGYPGINPRFSFCIKQKESEPITENGITAAYMQLMKDYNDRIKPGLSGSRLFSFDEKSYEPLSINYKQSLITSLQNFINNQDYVFRSQYGEFLAMGAFMTTTSIMALRVVMRRANVALAILPPNIVDEFFTMGYTPLYFPEDHEISTTDVEDLFKNHSTDKILEMMEADPRLEAYLYHLLMILHRQTANPNQA